MNKVSVIIAILIMSFTLSSCFTYTTVVGEGSKRSNNKKPYNKMSNFF